MIGVETPEKAEGPANLNYIFSVTKQIVESIEEDCIIGVKATVPIGTNDKIEKFIRENLKHPVRVSIVLNPKFLEQGTAVRDTHPSRIVIGGENEKAIIKMKELYTINVQKCFQQVTNDIIGIIFYYKKVAPLCHFNNFKNILNINTLYGLIVNLWNFKLFRFISALS